MSSRGIETRQHSQFNQSGGAISDLQGPASAIGKRQGDTKDDRDAIQRTIKNMLGNKLEVVNVNSVNLDLHEGYAHSTTGIPYAVNGTADVIKQKFGVWLTAFQDPIKAILTTSVHRQHRIIVTRKYVVGGAAMITPERAPARTVAIKEDAREVTLTRYGGDIEMNLNLFLRPEDAREELDMKMDAQRQHLENKLIEIGYDTIMAEGTNIVDGIMRSNPAYNGMDVGGNTMKAVRIAADRIYSKQIFGALAKQAYAVPNLLAATRYASSYTIGTLANPVVILPHGTPDLLRYTKPESMVYSISGVKAADGAPIKMELENAFRDPVTGAQIMIHHPKPSYAHGSVRPTVGEGGLTGITKIAQYYQVPAVNSIDIVDYNSGCWKTVNVNQNSTYVRVIEFVMSSAIVAAPNGQAGELLHGYPQTGVSTSQATESMRIQLRTYMGCVITNPESVFVLPNVAFHGIRSGASAIVSDLFAVPGNQPQYGEPFELDCNAGRSMNGAVDGNGDTFVNQHQELDGCFAYAGAYRYQDGGQEVTRKNMGHLGALDSPEQHTKLWGAQMYDNSVALTAVKGC